MDQLDEVVQMKLEFSIVKVLNLLYPLLKASDRPEAEELLGHVAEFKAKLEGDGGSKA